MCCVNMWRELQADCDDMVESARLREDVDQITRYDLRSPLAGAIGLVQRLTKPIPPNAPSLSHGPPHIHAPSRTGSPQYDFFGDVFHLRQFLCKVVVGV